MKLKDLIGYQLVAINDEKIVVEKDDKTFTIEIYEYEGDCCGFNNLEITSDIKNNPVITNVKYEEGDAFDSGYSVITFYGLDKKLAEINSYSSSGSGWAYGATVSVVCSELDIDEILSSW